MAHLVDSLASQLRIDLHANERDACNSLLSPPWIRATVPALPLLHSVVPALSSGGLQSSHNLTHLYVFVNKKFVPHPVVS